jgi:DNA-binding protein HU-beta
MPTKKSSKSYTKTSRCWPGYEPVPGKSEHEEGSCRKKPAKRNAGKQVSRETARKKQIARGGKRAVQAKASAKPRNASRRKAA